MRKGLLSMIGNNLIKLASILFSIVLLLGCNLEADSSNSNTDIDSPTNKVALDLNVGSIFSQRLSSASQPSAQSRSIHSRTLSNQNALGELKITDLSDDSVQTVDWPVAYNGEQFTLISNKTIALNPGIYDFEFLVDIENHQYAGTSLAVLVNDTDELNIDMTVQAVLGDTYINVDQIADLPYFKLVYPANELTNLTLPKLGVLLDEDSEVILTLAPQNEDGQIITEQYLSLNEGAHSLKLVLYEDNIQVGKSVEAQEAIIVVPGEAISLNLMPLSGLLAVNFNEEGGDAQFSFIFPNTVIEEAGSLEQLDIKFKLSGSINNPQDVLLSNLADNGDGTSTASYIHTEMQAEEITLALEFYDNRNNELLANCLMENVSLDKTDNSPLCSIQLKRRSVIQGHVLATLGINVYDQNGDPVSGALVKVDGELMGITGTNNFSTAGFLSLNVIPGTHDIRAENTDMYGAINDEFTALQVANIDITLDTDVVPPSGRPFITTWKTDNTGETNDDQIEIPTIGGGYDYQIDWGDGSSDENVNDNITHTYTIPGTYTVSISGDFPQIYFLQKQKLLSVEQWGTIQWRSMTQAFRETYNFQSNATDTPNLSQVSDMSYMFDGARVFNGDISNWDVSAVTDMNTMFAEASAFNQDISNWNVSSVTHMGGMFRSASSFNQDISNWDVSHVREMMSMFNNAWAFNQDISSWNVSSVLQMHYMFDYATSFDQNLRNWDVSLVRGMRNMFRSAALSTANYDGLLAGWSSQNLESGVSFDAGSTQYSSSSQAARDVLTNTHGWIVADGGVAPSQP